DLVPSIKVVTDANVSLSFYLVLLFFTVPLWSLMLYLNGMYRPFRTKSLFEVVWTIVKSAFLTTIACSAVIFLFKLKFVSRLFFSFFIVVCVTLLLAEKLAIYFFLRYVRKRGYNFRRLIVVGTGRRAADFIDRIQSHPEWGFRIIGAIEDEPGRGIKKVKDIKVIGILDDLPKILHNHAVDEVIFVIPRLRLSHIEDAIRACELEGVKATIAVDLFDLKIAKAHQTELEGIPLLSFKTTIAKEWQLFIKRGMDLVLSGLGIVILSPLFLVAAVLIKATTPGPVLFKQKRVGLNNRRFVLYKFRTMYKGAAQKLSELKALNEMEGPVFKIKKDPRITPIGRILRKFSIDEFPQLFNVFVGHMSLIGPRPPIPEEVQNYECWQRRRLSMRPGITCLWQVNGRNRIDFEEWMKLDLEYLDNWSLWLDLKILVKTIPVVLFGIGAY
ncbi:MAG: sugar transferase, partial [Candidatus Hodarchaeota archaeon]